ncbi:hydrogenase [Sulfurimonas sp.]|uniref:hydrogenase n=1 Tax=Sulfurimonas sp. TaxID=2022749 RepID=UPI002B4598E7|nr:hydrogenase [Sulfurimonas sp.]
MLLEFVFEYSSSSLVYEKVLLRVLSNSKLEGKLVKVDKKVKLFVESENSTELEEFANNLSLELPHSIFLDNTQVNVVDAMPDEEFVLPSADKAFLSFCPSCLKKVLDESNENFYNPFCECEVCGYDANIKPQNHQADFQKIAKSIADGNNVKVNTFYGEYYLGKLSSKCNDISFDVLSYDLASVGKYTSATENEIIALGAIEKPLIKLKTNLKFKVDFEGVDNELLRFKLADDLILHFISLELQKNGINLVFITQQKIEFQDELLLVEPKTNLVPIECVVGEKNIIILSGNKGLPKFPLSSEKVVPFLGAFNSVIREHKLFEQTVVGLNLSKDYHNNILAYSKKFGIIEYLSFKFEFSSISQIFEAIDASDEKASKLLKSYKAKYPEHCEKISKITFDGKDLNVYKLWGIIAIILDLSDSEDLYTSGNILENNAKLYLGEKGPRIDYKLQTIKSKVFLDPLMVIRTAMTFRLADIDPLSLCYGVIESFVEFIATQLDEIKHSMNTDVVVATGSLLGNNHLFSKLDKEVSINHKLYFNKQLPVDGDNILYGGNELVAN